MQEIARYAYRHEAELAAGFLDDAGIRHIVQVDDAGGAEFGLAFLRPARLLVADHDVAEAKQVLEDAGFPGLPR